MTRKDLDLGPIDQAPAMARVLDLVAWMIERPEVREASFQELRRLLPAARGEVIAFENLRRSLS